MGAISNTSTLLSSSSQHHRHRTSGRYGIGSVGRACANNLKTNRQNVAIATQVLSPKALSQHGSLNRRRLVPHFGAPPAEDEESFMSRKKRVAWGKFCCYGISITVIVLIMTGVVLAVGYMQSEKQRILSRSVKLAQEQSLETTNSISTLQPQSIVIPITKEFPPTTTEQMSLSKESEEGEDFEELQILEPPERVMKELKIRHNEMKGGNIIDIDENEAETDDREESQHRPPSEVKVLPPKDFTYDGFSFEFPIYHSNSSVSADKSTTMGRINLNNNGNNDFSFSMNSVEDDPPIPILSENDKNAFSSSGFNYTFNSTISFQNLTDFGTLSGSDEQGNIDIPVVAKLQTDLFSDDSEGSASTKFSGKNTDPPPKPTEQDNSYTPRPSSVVHYSEIPQRSSSKESEAANDEPMISYNPNPTTATSVTTIADTKLNSNNAHLPKITEYKFDFQTPVTVNREFKYDFTTPSSSVNSDFKLDLKALAENSDYKFQLPTTTEFKFDFHQLTTPAPPGESLHSSQNNDFSKRTYPNFDFDSTGSSSNTNHFAHLLNPQIPTGVIGTPSATGAQINFQQPSYNFESNYDIYGGGQTHNIPSGVVPLDLAASYIQVGNPPKSNYGSGGNTNNYGSNQAYNFGGNYGGNDASSSFSYNNPTLALASLIQNDGGGANGGDPNKAPNYNTITQGIHLLSLLSGNIPHHLLNDQHNSASAIHEQHQQQIAKPEYQIAALTGYGGSSNAFLSGLNNAGGGASDYSNPYLPVESRNIPVYASDLHSSKTFSARNIADQLPSESSFSQNIISKIGDFGGSFKTGDLTGSKGLASSTVSAALASHHPNPQSISFNIIPQSGDSTSFSSFPNSKQATTLNSDVSSTSLKTRVSKQISDEGPSRKKDSAIANSHSAIADFLRSDLEVAASDIHTRNFNQFITTSSPKEKSTPFGRKLVIKTAKIKDEVNERDIQERGLKSGFYF